MTLEVNYLGSNSHRLLQAVDVNPPLPGLVAAEDVSAISLSRQDWLFLRIIRERSALRIDRTDLAHPETAIHCVTHSTSR
jgi:hypothetical protein